MASVNARTRRGAGRSESGVSIIEYAAVIVLAGVILGSAGLYLLSGQIAKNVPPALCVLLSAGTEDCGGGNGADGPNPGPSGSPTAGPCSGGRPGTKKDDAFKPPLCEKLYEKEYSKSTYKMLFIKITDEFAFIRQEYSDGTVRLTALSTGHLGVEVESGLNVFKSGGVEVGGKIGGGLNMAVGDTYVFKDKGEADDKINEIKSYYRKVRQEQGRAQSKFCIDNPIMSSCRVSDPPDMDDPQITTKSIGGEGSGGLKLGNLTGGKKDKDKGKDKKDKDDEDGGKSLSLNLLGGEGKLAGETIEEKDNRDPKNPKTSKIYSFTVSGEGTAGLLHGKGSKNVSLKVTHDKDGKLVGVVMSEAVESPRGEGFNLDFAGQVGPVNGSYGKTERKGRYDVRTAQLEVTDDNRSVVEDWLTGQKSGAGDLADEVGEPVELGKDSTDWDKVKKEFYDHGKVSKVLYDTEFESESVGWGINFLGMEFGVAAEWGREGRESVAADFLGAPDGKNPRDWVDFPECVHKDGGDGEKPPPPPPPPGCPTKKD